MMDTDKLYKRLTEAEEIQDVPTIYVVRVAVAVLRIIEDLLIGKSS